jgi:hypothetical protein
VLTKGVANGFAWLTCVRTSLDDAPSSPSEAFIKVSEGEGTDSVIGADIEPVVGCDQRLEMVQARHGFGGAAAREQRPARPIAAGQAMTGMTTVKPHGSAGLKSFCCAGDIPDRGGSK